MPNIGEVVINGKPLEKGWYYVTLYQFKKGEAWHADYFEDWVGFDGENWDYTGTGDSCRVCAIHRKEK